MYKTDYIFGLRPIIEALDSGRTIDKLLLKKDLQGEAAAELLELARVRRVPVQRVPQERLNRITMKNHQGAIALLAAIDYYPIDNLIPELFEQGGVPLIVALDRITDVRNFGAIARTCECAGVDAIILPQQESVSVTADAVKTSAGALMHIPVCRVPNLFLAIRQLKDSGCQIISTSDKGASRYTDIDFTLPTVIVMGAEDTGVSDSITRICDAYAAIPEFGKINSLNVSVATGIMVYEAVRQRLNENFSLQ